MSFLLNRRLGDFARELDFDQLLAVNGGCGGSFTGDSGYTGGGENHGYNSYGSGSSGSSSSGSGSCSGSGGYSGGSSSSGSGSCSGGTSSIPHQVAYDPEHVDHCDIIAYNEAIDHGIKDPGSWNGNHDNVETIYENNYAGKEESKPEAGSEGYVFYDWADTAGHAKDHMEYYECSADGSTYTVWQTTGKENPSPKTYTYTLDSNGKGKTGSTAVFVKLN